MYKYVIYGFGSVIALFLTILVYIYIIPEKRRSQLNRFGRFLQDLCNFKFFVIEKILRFLYVLTTSISLVGGLAMTFWVQEQYHLDSANQVYVTKEWMGYYGLLLIFFGPIIVRLVYEILMLGLVAVKNIIQINRKIKDRSKEESDTE